MSTTLDCGHTTPALPEGHVGGTGVAETADGRRICYACAADQTRADMLATGKATLYVVACAPRPLSAFTRAYEITDWSGALRMPVVYSRRWKGRGFGGQYDCMSGLFTGPDGREWSFRNAGNNQLARCKRIYGSAK